MKLLDVEPQDGQRPQDFQPFNYDQLLYPREGLSRLGQFLLHKVDFKTVQPFLLDLTTEANMDSTPDKLGCWFFIEKFNGKTLTLRFRFKQDQTPSSGKFIIFPHSRAIGDKPYYWLDIHQYDDAIQDYGDTSLVKSCRLKPEDPINKIDFMFWRGVNEQILVDYINEENGITFENLRGFFLRNDGSGYWTLGKRNNLPLDLTHNHVAKDAPAIFVKTAQDEYKLYQWINVFAVETTNQQGTLVKAREFRIDRKHHRITKDWQGYEKQLLIDFAGNNGFVTFDMLKPIPVEVPPHITTIVVVNSTIHNLSMAFYIDKDEAVNGEKMLVLPRTDENHRYQWLELHRIDLASDEPTDPIVAWGRLENGKLTQSGWKGPEIQLLLDYMEGLVLFDDLKPIPVVLTDSRVIYLTGLPGRVNGIFIRIPSLLDFKSGDSVLFIPNSASGIVIDLLLSQNGDPRARYRLNTRTGQTYLETIFYQGGELQFKGLVYIDSNSTKWVTANRLAKIYRLNSLRVANCLVTVRSQNIRYASAQTYYPEKEAIAVMEKRGLISAKLPTPKEANEWLRQIVEDDK